MELGKHLGKGIWGAADKALPALYGLGFVLLVIRVLPEEEFGNFVLIQEIFLIISGFAMGFALQPMLKYAAEDRPDRREIIGAALFLNAVFVVVCSIGVVLIRHPFGELLNSRGLADLMLYLPALLIASFARNFTLVLLQTRFMMKEIFWTDAAHFIGAVALIAYSTARGGFASALDMINVNLVSLSASSLLGLFLARPIFKVKLTPHLASVRLLWHYGKYSLGSVVSYLFYTKADSFILSSYSGPVQVAMYNSVKMLLRLFDTMSQVINMFVVPAASRLSSQGERESLRVLVEKAIAFGTLALFPVFILFVFFPSPLVYLMYGGRYLESVVLVQVFALLSFVTPLYGVAGSALLGLGLARTGFYLSVVQFVVSVVVYAACIPLWGPLGATIGYVITSVVITWVTTKKLQDYLPFTLRDTTSRWRDVTAFIQSKFGR